MNSAVNLPHLLWNKIKEKEVNKNKSFHAYNLISLENKVNKKPGRSRVNHNWKEYNVITKTWKTFRDEIANIFWGFRSQV